MIATSWLLLILIPILNVLTNSIKLINWGLSFCCTNNFGETLQKEESKYRKMPIMRPELIFFQKTWFGRLIFGPAYLRTGVLSQRVLRLKMG